MKFKFSDLLCALQEAVDQARITSESQHLQLLKNFFEPSDDGKTFRTKNVTVEVPANTNDKNDTRSLTVPLITLMPLNSLNIDEVKVDFEARLNFSANPEAKKALADGGPVDVSSTDEAQKFVSMLDIELKRHGTFSRSTPVKVSLTFKAADPPEGLSKLNDHMNRDLN